MQGQGGYAELLRAMLQQRGPRDPSQRGLISPAATGGQDVGSPMGTPYGGTGVAGGPGIVNTYSNAGGQRHNELDDPSYQQPAPPPDRYGATMIGAGGVQPMMAYNETGGNGPSLAPSPGLGSGAPASQMYEDNSRYYPGRQEDPLLQLLTILLNNRFPNGD